MHCSSVVYSRHALQRMFGRGLTTADVASVIAAGEVIEDYPTDFPYPSCLLLDFVGSLPVHIVAARIPALQ